MTCVLASEEDTPPELAEALGSTLVSSRTAFARLFVLAEGAAAVVASFAISSGVAAGAYNVLKTWVEAKNNRKLKIKVGDIEVDATQMKEEEVLRIFEMLEEKADQKEDSRSAHRSREGKRSVQEGINSGPATEMTREDFEQIGHEVHAKPEA